MAARKIAVYKIMEAKLVAFETEYGSIVVDCSTPKGMTAAKACRKEVRDVRLNLEDLRKEAKAPVLAKGKQIDAEAKTLTERLDVLYKKFDDSIKAIENKAAIAKQQAFDEAEVRVKEFEAREAAILAKEIELGIRKAPPKKEAQHPVDDEPSAFTATSPDSVESIISELDNTSILAQPHIEAASLRLKALKRIRGIIEPTDAQPTGDIDPDIARQHDEALGLVWEIVDEYK